MSLAEQLGVADPSKDLLALAAEHWSEWQGQFPALRACGDMLDLRDWALNAPYEQANEAHRALVWLSCPQGGDDPAANALLVWTLVPGAARLASSLADVERHIDEHVAAQLWIQARSARLTWQGSVASNILLNTRRAVLDELGIGTRSPSVAAISHPLDQEFGWVAPPEDGQGRVDEKFYDLAQSACDNQRVSSADVEFLLELAHQTSISAGLRETRTSGGLMAALPCEALAQRLGCSAPTVKRRARKALQAMRSELVNHA
ncbi:hypothetical protein K0651_13360 [Ornithinimicrobium sp. Arc0846-15]|nr:hypothetical protein [Ornithinimicrobium laminariae]